MRKLNYLWVGICGLAIALSGSAVLALPTSVPTPVMPTAVAQLNPSPSIFNEPPFNRVPRAQAPAIPSSSPASSTIPDSTTPDQKPVTAITPVNGKINIRFINGTGCCDRL